MKKIILKSALMTLGIVVGFAVVLFAVLSLGFPSTMAGWCEQVGNYKLAVRYAVLAYSYSGKIDDLARCVNNSVLAEDNSLIIEYGVKLIDDEEFDDYCASADAEFSEAYPGISYSYCQYIYGCVAGAYYEMGELESALAFAVEALDEDFDRSAFVLSENGEYDITLSSFPRSNALGSLGLKVISNEDAVAAGHLLGILDGVTAVGEEQQDYLDTIIEYLKRIIGQL